MELQEILQQQVEIDDLFAHLAKLHKVALFGDDKKDSSNENIEDNLSLNNIRNDITVCLNDFNVLNNMLIAFDGKIKGEINFLHEAKESINKMKSRQLELQHEQKEWKYVSKPSKNEATFSGQLRRASIEIKTSYRYKMNKYIEMVGIDNTSLSCVDENEVKQNSVLDKDIQLSGTQTTEALHLLDDSYDEIQKEIKALNSIMNDLKKDANFLENERRQKLGYIKLQQKQCDHELNTLDTNIKSLLNKCGLVLPSDSDVPISQKLLNLSLYWDEGHNKKLREENEDIIDHSDEFIELKIKALKDQLTHRKSNSTKLLSDKTLWEDCVSNLEDLEDSLNKLLVVDQTILPSKLIQKIKIKIDYLESLLTYTENNKIKELIRDEIYSLKMACEELSPNQSLKEQLYQNDSIYDKTNDIQSNFNINHSTKAAVPFVVGKSPPKIGISQEQTSVIPHTLNKKEA